ncbi:MULTISPECIES: CDP-diacylglycerol--serine O-phosphatidyltransferase [Fusobacterium]|uniref:CDP-diacylglycerol--serine O-phosphatidyltransferase n=1 Tax=Fusobacterium TaxID=848 RepID=UPI001476E15B|nr:MULTISPECIES: CDP-diacylglycerol--serine O-phosphatidyltransferase [Fusobacterium]NME35772.1 CDP-diacylglycerol--serine O-phosphatidyltransferase [Fusobacterium sp. FSA-380-WT-3A]
MVEKKYLAPNGITAANMLLGYLSITASIKGNVNQAIWFIFLAMVCDGLDGKAARKFDAFSEFGKEFDSFSDAISFGLAPSILVYSILSQYPKYVTLAMPVAFIYALCGVMRLVKFNVVTVASSEKDDFSGMPIPNGAASIISYLLICNSISNYGYNLFNAQTFIYITVIAAILMVSTITFLTPDKVFNFVPKKFMPLFIIFILVTLKYSMFICSFYYIIYNLFQYHLYRKELKNSIDNDGNFTKEKKEIVEEKEIVENKEEIVEEKKEIEK